eukprot:252196-Prymnesium_polylepis.1
MLLAQHGALLLLPLLLSPCLAIVAPADVAVVKGRILQISALTDRGQRLNPLIAPTYQELRPVMDSLVAELSATEVRAVAPLKPSAGAAPPTN